MLCGILIVAGVGAIINVGDHESRNSDAMKSESAVQTLIDSPPMDGEFVAEQSKSAVIKLPAGLRATMKFSKLTDEYDSVIVIETKEYDGPSLVNIPIRDQHGNFLGSLQIEATKP
jgi:hypothetical protein